MVNRRRPSPLIVCAAFYGLIFLAIVWHYYPNRVDVAEAIHFQPTPEQQAFYNEAFDPQQARYQALGRLNAVTFHIQDDLRAFVAQNNLGSAHVLEIGAGEGSLQDVVEDYTGLDISATTRRNYHKRFVQADARAIPFRDGEFDAAWSVWVLEHVPNAEQALREIRRVLKPNGLLYLRPAWLCSDLAPNGYPIRPYSDFGLGGKLIKASVPIQEFPVFQLAYLFPIRAARLGAWAVSHQPTALHYRPIAANYRQYWMPDSDAVNSIDMFEAYLWFLSRGDECLNCPSRAQMMRTSSTSMPLIIRVKPHSRPTLQSATAGR